MNKKTLAAIFDMDGLIFDSEGFYANAWADTFNALTPKEHNIDKQTMIKWFFENLSGNKIGELLPWISEQFPHSDVYKICDEYRKLFKARLLTDAIDINVGYFNLVKFLKSKGFLLALTSTATMDTITNMFKNADADLSVFDVIVSGDMGLKFKPDPEPYIKTCEMLNVETQNAVVFEDSYSGLLSSHNAGIKTILVPGRARLPDDSKDLAFAVCSDLNEAINVIEDKILNK